MSVVTRSSDFVCGPRAAYSREYFLFTIKEASQALAIVQSLPEYEATPLRSLDGLAAECGVRRVLYKDESARFGAGYFKSTGAAYAIHKLAEQVHADRVSLSTVVVASATAGNYGRALAWACTRYDFHCRLFVSSDVSSASVEGMRALGADVEIVAGTYGDAMRAAAARAEQRGWWFVADTVVEEHSEPARHVATGYSVIVDEILRVTRDFTHVIIPVGVGGLAAGIATALLLRGMAPKIILAEPLEAACFLESARADALAKATGSLRTLARPLACAEPSPPAWRLLRTVTNGFVAVNDASILKAVDRLSDSPPLTDASVGFCAATATAAFFTILENELWRRHLGIDGYSSVLILGTDGQVRHPTARTQ